MNAEVTAAAAKIELLILDVDGVLTDGGLFYDAEGRIMKRFHVGDGLGIKLAQGAGMEVAVISGLDSKAVETRVLELGIVEYYAGKLKKVPMIEDMLQRKGLEWSQAAYMGDDWVDAAPMRRVGLPMAPADAVPEIISMARWVASRPGGRGAVREGIDFILSARGDLTKMWDLWSGE